MKSSEIYKKFINFYVERGHKQIPSVSLIPENDPTLLYVNSGMFPLVPYLTGEKHPLGTRLTNVQRSLRFFEDIDNIGNTLRHTTAFHMLGNWSLGEYFKKEQLPWVYEFLIEELGLDPNRMYATVFEGDKDAPRDEESIEILKEIFKKYGIDAKVGERIFPYDKKENWWQRGDAIGELGGPDSEIFYYLGPEGEDKGQNPAENDVDFLEIGNSVFIQYKKTKVGWKEISQKNVDFGGGLERLALISQGKSDIYETDNFWPVIEKIQEISGKEYHSDPKVKKSMRVLADHMRASVLLAMDGVTPSNKDQGYILRRLLRRMVRFAKSLEITEDVSVRLVSTTTKMLAWLYPELPKLNKQIEEMFKEEEEKFFKTLRSTENKVKSLLEAYDGDATKIAQDAFDLYQSSGYPHEMLLDDAEELEIKIDGAKFIAEYEKLFKEHQEKSRKGAEGKFKGGLADHSETVTKYHTTTHLLHWALREVLGEHISQKGSNITGERLRFDFPHDGELTDKEIRKIEKLINEKIDKALPVKFVMMPKEEALKTGATHAFNEKYGDEVKIYYIGDNLEGAFSKEFCGGPHVENTKELKHVEIFRQESVGKGVRRVYARFNKS